MRLTISCFGALASRTSLPTTVTSRPRSVPNTRAARSPIGPRPQHQGALRLPAQSPLDGEALDDRLLDDGERLEEHADRPEPGRELHQELRAVHVVVRHKPWAPRIPRSA